MKNPLIKRLPRQLKDELGKYIVIFLFMILVIGFVSGFLVSANSMIFAYNESFDKYNCEYGHFITKDEPGIAAIESIEEETNVEIDEQFYYDLLTTGETLSENTNDTSSDESTAAPSGNSSDGSTAALSDNSPAGATAVPLNISSPGTSTLRLFKIRENMNTACLMDGSLPSGDNEICIDRMYASNNGFEIGDSIIAGGQSLTITGLVALPDYSALFSDNSDMMFDAVKFGVGIVSEDCFNSYEKTDQKLIYEYVWRYNSIPADEDEQIDMSDEFLKTVVKYVTLDDYLPRYANQAIKFTGVDFGGDSQLIKVILYVLIVVIAFVFSITIRHTIVREATVIGTLRASGYTKGELLRHYIALPVLITLISALIGNILGYTVFKDIAASMYYGSYSLPTFVVLWNSEAFILTTVFPTIIMFIINLISISRALRLSPLRFLRRDLTKKKRSKAIRLPRVSFFSRFRLRIVFQNMGNYITMFIGIALANIFLLFGMMMGPLLTHYQDEVLETMPAKYQYILKTQIETSHPKAEKFCMSSLQYYPSGEKDGSEEGFSVYGIEQKSEYLDIILPEEGVAISDGIKEKYGINVGDEISLHEEYENKDYTFKIGSIVSYPSSLAIFMSREDYNDIVQPEMGITDVINNTEMLLHRLATPPEYEYYNGYFSNEELTDISNDYIQTCITETDLTKVSRQLDVSMGTLFQIWNVFAIILFSLLIYLLTKLVLERNTTSISMVKILGYKDSEVGRLYLLATTWVVILSIVISFFIATPVIYILYHIFMAKMSGWLTVWINWDTYAKMFGLGVIAYALVAALQYIKIRRIPMDEALKNVE